MLNDYDDEIGYVAKMNIFYNETGAGIKKTDIDYYRKCSLKRRM